MLVDTESDTNLMLIIDVSGSMGSLSDVEDPENPGGHLTRLQAAIVAINKLLDEYADRGDVRVQIVKFSTNAEQVGSDWMTVQAAQDELDGLSANGNTNYDAALLEAMDIFTHSGKLTGSGVQNVSYFLSDGEPTTGTDWPLVPGTNTDSGIQSLEQAYWESFLTTNNIVSFALGISNVTNVAPLTANLHPIAFDPASGDQLADTPIIVDDLNDLDDTLVSTASSASGSLLSEGNSFGADGGYVKSITVDGVTYTFDPTANGGLGSITSSGSFNYDGTSKILTVETDAGGSELSVKMTTGEFTFQPSTSFTNESVGFTLTDGDNDTATARCSSPAIRCRQALPAAPSISASPIRPATWVRSR